MCEYIILEDLLYGEVTKANLVNTRKFQFSVEFGLHMLTPCKTKKLAGCFLMLIYM